MGFGKKVKKWSGVGRPLSFKWGPCQSLEVPCPQPTAAAARYAPVINGKRDYEVRESRIFISFLAAFNASQSRTAITRSPTNTSALIVCKTRMKVATQPPRL